MSRGYAVVLWTMLILLYFLLLLTSNTRMKIQVLSALQQAPERHKLSPSVEGVGDGRPFFTEPYRDFSKKEDRDQFAKSDRRF